MPCQELVGEELLEYFDLSTDPEVFPFALSDSFEPVTVADVPDFAEDGEDVSTWVEEALPYTYTGEELPPWFEQIPDHDGVELARRAWHGTLTEAQKGLIRSSVDKLSKFRPDQIHRKTPSCEDGPRWRAYSLHESKQHESFPVQVYMGLWHSEKWQPFVKYGDLRGYLDERGLKGEARPTGFSKTGGPVGRCSDIGYFIVPGMDPKRILPLEIAEKYLAFKIK